MEKEETSITKIINIIGALECQYNCENINSPQNQIQKIPFFKKGNQSEQIGLIKKIH
jgi:hypothetical protein